MGATKSKRSYKPAPTPGGTSSPPRPKSVPAPLPKVTDEDMITEQVGILEDMGGKSMKAFPIHQEGCSVLIINRNGQFYATGSKCTHYGAPLENGALGDDCVRCPWHGASFCIKTGDIEDFPGINHLPTYKVTIQDTNKIMVTASKKALLANRREPKFSAVDPKESKVFVVLGGGPAGMQCVSSLRENGFTGRLIFVMAENVLPYDRVKLSKNLAVDVNTILLRSEEFYKERSVELRRGVKATGLNSAEKSITLSDDTTIPYDKVFLATGSRPRQPNIPGVTLKNVFTLRESTDASAINGVVKNKQGCNVVILGASFIGLEVAATLKNACTCNVSVIGNTLVPFQAPLGRDVGVAVKNLFEKNQVRFYTETSIAEILGTDDGTVKEVRLTDEAGTVLPADLVVIAIGVVSNTEFLKDSGINLRPNGTIEVDENLKAIDNVYAGGDIAHAPVLDWKAPIGHIGVAQYHGKVAAANMAGVQTPLRTAPFFWTALFGKNFRYAGFTPDYNKVDIVGSVDDLQFVSLYSRDGAAHAVLTCGRDPIAAEFLQKLMEAQNPLKREEVLEWLSSHK